MLRVPWFLVLLSTFCSLIDVPDAYADMLLNFGTGPNQFSIDLVSIGSPGNAPDSTGSPTSVGGVAYGFAISKFEISESMIDKYNSGFGTAAGLAIAKDVRGPDKPATYVTWNEAARFVNWLGVSSGGSPAYKFTTNGVNDNLALWMPAEVLDYDPANPFRSLRASFALPNVDEWYKAAYFDPSTNSYFDYATGSNSPPTAVLNGTASGTAVYNSDPLLDPPPADIADAGGLNPFGLMAMNGNVWEWNETEFDLINDYPNGERLFRGGSVDNLAPLLRSTYLGGNNLPTLQKHKLGFRVVALSPSAVPEPSSIILVLAGLVPVLRNRRKTCLPSDTPKGSRSRIEETTAHPLANLAMSFAFERRHRKSWRLSLRLMKGCVRM